MITDKILIHLCVMSLVLVLGLLLDLNYGKTFTSLKKWALKRVRRKVIYRGDGKPYLIRYTPFTCKAFSIKIHNILLSDPSCQHDHPWSFLTVILKGGYIEHTPTGSKYHSAGTTLYRPAEFAHRLEVDKPVWSFVITFKKVRKWGFFTKKGWVIWYKYQPENTCE